MKHVVFSDFDGTITAKDTIDAMYEAFGLTHWSSVAKDLYRQGHRSRMIIKKMLGMLEARKDDIVALLRTLPIREGFVEFYRYCRAHELELVIMSEGVGISVETVLHERGIDDLPYFGNVLAKDEHGKWTTLNPHQHPECDDCGNCKSSHLIRRKKRGEAVIYIGDGATDRCPAQVADIVFANGYLAKFCERSNIPSIYFSTFHDVIREMEKPDFVARLEAEAVRDLDRKTTLPSPEVEGVPAEEGSPYDKGIGGNE